MSAVQVMMRGRGLVEETGRSVLEAFREEAWTGDRRTVAMSGDARPDRMDFLLLLVTAALLALGLIMVFSSSSVRATLQHHNPYGSLAQQGMRAGVGFLMLLGLARFNYRHWWTIAPLAAGVTLFLLGLLFVPGLGEAHKGAQRWLRLGPISLQPTEFARVGAIILMARLLARRPERMREFLRGPLPALLAAGVFVAFILLQKSLGCSVALVMTAVSMCFVAGLRWKHLAWLGASAVAGLLIVTVVYTLTHRAPGAHHYQTGRILSWLQLWRGQDDPQGSTYQLHQSILAIGSGGVTGKGIGDSEQKWLFLPDAHTDFIFSILGEEMGFLGACGLLLLFALFVWRGLRIASEADDRFGYLLAAGLTINFMVYILINVAVTMALLPTTGLPLPFISYGGSALLANMGAVGLLLSISRHRKSGIVLTTHSGRLR